MFIPFVIAGVLGAGAFIHYATAPKARTKSPAPPAEAPGPVGIAFAVLGTGVSVADSARQVLEENLAAMRNNATNDIAANGSPLRDRGGAMRDNVGNALAYMTGTLNRQADRMGDAVSSTATGAAVKDAVKRGEDTAKAKADDIARTADANAAALVQNVTSNPPPPPPTFRRPF